MDSALASEVTTAPRHGASTSVRVQAPARLHLGFLDPAGTLGRPFGSLGLAIEGLETVVHVTPAATDAFETFPGGGAALARARACVATLRDATGCQAPLTLRLRSAAPAHAGLGSGTQLALAVGRAFCDAFELARSNVDIATLLGRGVRSGVGIASFATGGLLLDGGPRADGAPAQVLARIALPAAWRVLLVLDRRAQGLSGTAERAALARLPPLPREAAAEICHEVLMRVLAGAAAGEFAPFSAGIGRMQEVLGSHFAPAQEGRAFTSAAVARLLHWAHGQGAVGIGQSSWGPTGFALLPSESEARDLLADARLAGVVDAGLDVLVIRPRNHGALVGVAPG